jgi:TPP-dependent pyruvate/acetoin dehydrogenase alpha subunit
MVSTRLDTEDGQRDALWQMLLIRRFEETVGELFAARATPVDDLEVALIKIRVV